MNKKRVIGYVILGIGLIIILVGVLLFVFGPVKEKDSSKNEDPSYGTDLEEDLPAKAMIYVADEYQYTSEDYNIDVTVQDNNYVVEVKTKEDELVEEITVDSNTLQAWTPDSSSPEQFEPINESSSASQPSS